MNSVTINKRVPVVGKLCRTEQQYRRGICANIDRKGSNPGYEEEKPITEEPVRLTQKQSGRSVAAIMAEANAYYGLGSIRPKKL